MEQAVWVSFGVLSAIIMVGIVAQLITSQSLTTRTQDIDAVLGIMEQQCDFVCKSSKGTRLGTEITLPSGVLMFTNQDRVCIDLDTQDVQCGICQCRLSEDKEALLNLTSDLARETFLSHAYTCLFMKEEGGHVFVECQG